MSRMKGLLAAMIPLALMSENGFGQLDNNSKLSEADIDFDPKQPPIPKGCKEYFFNKNGGFSNRYMRHDELVFKCVASNDKSAIRKFHNWDNLKYITF